MTLPQVKVEVGFDLTNQPLAPFFRLDDEEQGVLDNTEYRLAGTLFYDVTDFVQTFTINRGRSDLLATYPAGECQVDFNNHARTFDPLYPLSPFAGNIVPRREIRITSGASVVYTGWIEDWDLDYQPSGDSVATAKATDALAILGNIVVNSFTPVVQKAGARINAVLDRAEVEWPSTLRDIDTGAIDMGTVTVAADTNALGYLQNIAQSDPGQVFITADGKFAFRDRRKAPLSAGLVEFGGAGISFDSIQIMYGSELLFNDVTVSRESGSTAIAIDEASINTYGRRTLNITDMQMNDDADLVDISLGYASLYSQPEYRIEAMQVSLHSKSSGVQEQLLALELGDVCKITFTPNNIGDPIIRYGEIIRLNHTVDPQMYMLELGFQDTRYAPLVLDDAVFGKLDVGTLSW